MAAELTDKVAVITGGSRGIGRVTALALAEAGAQVVVNYARSSTAADEVVAAITAAGGSAIAVQADVSDVAQAESLIKAATDQWGRVDVLVNNAGITRDTLLLRMKPEDWQAVINLNLLGSFTALAPLASSCSNSAPGALSMLRRWPD